MATHVIPDRSILEKMVKLLEAGKIAEAAALSVASSLALVVK